MGADQIIDYHRDLDIRNTDQLPKGLGCRYLLALLAPYPDEYVAERWLRNLPASVPAHKVVIRFAA